ncbi:MAG: 16S rRNA (cytosine(967)-C(5))-methyltransferase RsmB [Acidobacteria bacterium]|nr:16S rRNA (cytosine(967)-C(5))-methyltransferase RsmB [Acidobacteriota bacterium]MCA1639367.1 16S rRNA (cytosine(967)-C(5))-methyltransferase RsmB [Acidobacteriota bacterium]
MSKPSIQNPKSKIQNRNVSPARVAAFEILQKIEKEKAYSSVLLPLYEENLSLKDRSLCHELTLGVLRKQIYLDKIVEKFTNKNIEKFDSAVRIALRIGLYQIFFTDKIPAFSAINESVNLVHQAKKSSASGLVNAVLRRAARGKIELSFADETEKISVENSFPRWLIEKWIQQFSLEAAEKIAIASNETPNLAFRFTLKTTDKTKEFFNRKEREETAENVKKRAYLENGFSVVKLDEQLRELAGNGEVYFQDEGSQMVAEVVNLQAVESFLDVCAAPGSKSTLIASKFKVQSSKLFVAGDFYAFRVEVMRENCRKQAVDFIQILRYDAEKSLPFADESFDVVLVDAPCTGTGTIRHNPEIRYFLQKEDFAALAEKQLKILKNASKLIKRGGRLIYSTCSMEIEENETVSKIFLTDCTEFQKVSPDLPERFLTEEGFARTFPDRDKMDGFFIAIFERK